MSSTPSSDPRRLREAAARCLACGARLGPAQAWCSLCHTSVPAPAAGPALRPDAGPGDRDRDAPDRDAPDRDAPDQDARDRDAPDRDARDGKVPDGDATLAGRATRAVPAGEGLAAVPAVPAAPAVPVAPGQGAGRRVAAAEVAATADRLIAELAAARQRDGIWAAVPRGGLGRGAAVALAVLGGLVLLAGMVLGMTLVGALL